MEKGIIAEYYVNLRDFLNNEQFIERELEIKEIPNKIISLVGPRRAGKTFYMFNIMRKKLDSSIYFDFEIGFLKNVLLKR